MFLLPVIDDDETQNRFWNASLDGRAIHSFLLWVEPHSNAWARRAAGGAGGSGEAASAVTLDETPHALGRALVGLAGSPTVTVDLSEASAATDSPAVGPRIAVLTGTAEDGALRLRPAGPRDREATADARRILDGTGLGYVLDLGIGAVVLGDDEDDLTAAATTDLCDVAWPGRPGADPVAFAEALLREGARSWTRQWLRTEEAVGTRREPLPAADRTWLADVLADSLAFQLYDRLAAREPHDPASPVARRRQQIYDALRALRAELPDRVGRTVGMGIVAELVGTTYPCWNRRQFAVKSPFDYIREIRPLTDAEKAEHLSRWAAPTAVR
ncbi:hypothetical protein [Streptomyces sp. NPDC096934]|uniref:hypothetical protein n=1 Tax=Streptomyces sp. NPDC096934 TaxID=3155551 RepID=UPI003328F613